MKKNFRHSHKRTAFWMAAALLAAVIVAGVILLTNLTSKELPQASMATPAPDALASIPDGFVKNEAGATDAEVAAIFAVETESYDIKSVSGYGACLYIYARQSWRDGALLLAGVSPMGEVSAELYHISGGRVLMHTRGSDAWSINYTHYLGETIVFGESFAWDNGPLATDGVVAEFWNGETVSTPMAYTPDGGNDVTRGFICATPSTTWLKSLKIIANGETVADDGDDRFLFNPSHQPWYGDARSIRNRTFYVWRSDVRPADLMKSCTDAFGGYPSVTVETLYESEPVVTQLLTYWPDCDAHEGVSPDIWHSNNGLHHMVNAIAGSRITAQVTDMSDGGVGRKVSDLPVSQAYWVDLSVSDDENGIRKGELVCPAQQGYYVLILSTDFGCFSQIIKVE